jgi:hypothetical protein
MGKLFKLALKQNSYNFPASTAKQNTLVHRFFLICVYNCPIKTTNLKKNTLNVRKWYSMNEINIDITHFVSFFFFYTHFSFFFVFNTLRFLLFFFLLSFELDNCKHISRRIYARVYFVLLSMQGNCNCFVWERV